MNNGLRDYLKSNGARVLTEENCPALAEYRREMIEEVIPQIERDIKAQRRAAHFARLGISDPLASVDRNPQGEKPQALSAEHESAIAATSGETPNPSSSAQDPS